MAALEAVEFLVHRGKEVTLVDTAAQIGKGSGLMQLLKYPIWMQAVGVKTILEVKEFKEVPEGLQVVDKDGNTQTIECDTVMVVTQFTKNDALYNALEGVVAERYLVGDARSVDDFAYIHGSMRDGANAGLSI